MELQKEYALKPKLPASFKLQTQQIQMQAEWDSELILNKV